MEKKHSPQDLHSVSIKLVSSQATCPSGHKVGDEWLCGATLPGGLCANAFTAMYSTIWALQLGAELPFRDGSDAIKLSCPDPDVRIVFEVKRIKKK